VSNVFNFGKCIELSFKIISYIRNSIMSEMIKRPVFTEKTRFLLERHNQYVFDVDPTLTKLQCRLLLEKMFSVKILRIKTHLLPHTKSRSGGAVGYIPKFKRVIVSLAEGEKITLFLTFRNSNFSLYEFSFCPFEESWSPPCCI
jgi:large subunit ribosomal protein L23